MPRNALLLMRIGKAIYIKSQCASHNFRNSIDLRKHAMRFSQNDWVSAQFDQLEDLPLIWHTLLLTNLSQRVKANGFCHEVFLWLFALAQPVCSFDPAEKIFLLIRSQNKRFQKKINNDMIFITSVKPADSLIMLV